MRTEQTIGGTEDLVRKTAPHRLAEIMDPDEGEGRLWMQDELAAILKHQLAAPVEFDLKGLRNAEAEQIRNLSEVQGLLLKSFKDLLSHECPPVELLRLTQQFAKRTLVSPKSSVLPREIANVLYYSSIAAARLRCHRKISTLSDPELKEGINWCLNQPWLEPLVKALLEECRTDIEKSRSAESRP